ncbi:copper chaperone PCu(A)C [Alteromonas oceanisediminis]|uniref:copper chaperone PCu(A)C n=1 Tax=Alteromonas oceanisediminis TaxID=2836180 RepID=UPI001BDA095C|nr:copper chaperone PCu(A)C [Alteromonas oceanisediminis]MBT0586005.1 copper chaperone PCu(A)C [Alteromonas oceanisediminis]
MLKKLLFSYLFGACFLVSSAVAHEFSNDNFHIDHPWARPTFALATTGAAYLSIHNMSSEDDRLVAASVSAEVADEVQLHDVLMDGEMMKMREMQDGVVLPSRKTVEFRPGGKHIMLLGLKGPLNEGSRFQLTLHFAQGDDVEVTVNVEQPQGDKASEKTGEHKHHHNH